MIRKETASVQSAIAIRRCQWIVGFTEWDGLDGSLKELGQRVVWIRVHNRGYIVKLGSVRAVVLVYRLTS